MTECCEHSRTSWGRVAELPLLPGTGGVLFVFDLAAIKNNIRTYFIFF